MVGHDVRNADPKSLCLLERSAGSVAPLGVAASPPQNGLPANVEPFPGRRPCRPARRTARGRRSAFLPGIAGEWPWTRRPESSWECWRRTRRKEIPVAFRKGRSELLMSSTAILAVGAASCSSLKTSNGDGVLGDDLSGWHPSSVTSSGVGTGQIRGVSSFAANTGAIPDPARLPVSSWNTLAAVGRDDVDRQSSRTRLRDR